MAPEKRYYWWRAQAAMYTVRPNARTRAKLAELRREKLQLRLPSQESAISVGGQTAGAHIAQQGIWCQCA